jgi:protocatechuate 3,4-dioxygenase beta subunit
MTSAWIFRSVASVTIVMSAGLALAIAAPQATTTQAGQAGQGRAGGAATTGTAAGAAAPDRRAARDQQQQARDAQAPAAATGTGVITGVVSAGGGNGSPVRRARVMLSGPELRGGRSTVTNDQGQFTFSALPPGRFTMTASKAGYVDVPYGAKRPGRPGTPIQLAAAQKMEGANITLPKGGVITGVVVDDSGEPAPGTQVRVMRYVMRTGEKTLQQAGQAQADDRGIYRIYGLQPGDYLISAVPRNQGLGDLRNTIAAEIETAMQQMQAAGLGRGGGGAAGGGGGGRGAGGGGGRAGAAGIDLGQLMGGRGGNPDLMGRVAMLQEQLAQSEQEQSVAYAPVYYPGTPSPAGAAPVTLGISEEHGGVDFRLVLVKTAKVEGVVQSQDGTLPQGTQVSLVPMDQIGMPPIPGASGNTTRAGQDGRFIFTNVAPGQYRVNARANVRAVDPAQPQDATAAAAGGRGRGQGQGGGRGGPGQIAQVLWGSADVNVDGQDVNGVNVSLVPGMTVTGRVTFDSSTLQPPTDLTRVRVNITPRGTQQGLDTGGLPPSQVDATGRFTVTGVPPGRYSINANAAAAIAPGTPGGRGGNAGGGGAAAQWLLKSATGTAQDILDFGLVVEPHQPVAGITLAFVDRTQEVSGTIQDPAGKPTADFTIILFATDKSFWVPQARRIQSARPSTDGKFAFRNIPAGDYRLTAVTDVEPGEWFDPNFLGQLVNASIPVTVREGEKKVQDIKIAGG